MVPIGRIQPLAPTTPLVDAAPSLLAGGHRLVPVVADGHLRGVITAGDVARAVELAALGITPARRAHPAIPPLAPPGIAATP
jgi:CBS domain-containing protein